MPDSPVWHILASPRYAPATIAVNVTWMERGLNAGQTHRSMYPSIYREILVGNFNFFLPLAFNAPLGVITDPLDDLHDFWWVSCRMARLQYGAKISQKS